MKWIALAATTVCVFMWLSRSDRRLETYSAGEDKLHDTAPAAVTKAGAAQPPRQREAANPKARPPPAAVPPREAKPPRLAPAPIVEVKPRAALIPVDVDVFREDSMSIPTKPSASERFLAYSPHSGYHNQRISLENALTLAFMLDRTLLVPPIWLGHAIPYISFDKLGRRLAMASKDHLDRCKDFGDGGSADPIPRECEGFWSWTQVGWDFLVDLKDAKDLVPMRSRWNQSAAWLIDELHLRPGKGQSLGPDTYHLKDDVMYQYRFYDSLDDNEPLAKFERRLDVQKLAEDTQQFKLLHVGSMFGTSRMRVTKEENFDARSEFRRSMMFKNELLDEITATIRDRLGGPGKYYGLHLRVGDGIFQKEAGKNMAGVWDTLCVKKMKLSEDLCRSITESHESRGVAKRALTDHDQTKAIDCAAESSESHYEVSEAVPSPHEKRANSRPQRDGAYNHAPLPRLPVITSRSDSPLTKVLTCRGKLHQDPAMLPFNAPLFIATDSKIPTTDPNLAIFFDTFPCTFVLGDFASKSAVNSESVEALNQLNALRNKDDKVPLAQFLYPQLDAQIAAWGRDLIGTPQSTYSRFAVDILHQMYQ